MLAALISLIDWLGARPIQWRSFFEERDVDRMPSLRRMTSNIAAQIMAFVASMVDRIVLVGILLRAWGPDVFSDFAVLQSVAQLLVVAELSMQLYFINVMQSAHVNGDQAAFRRLSSIHLGVILTIVSALGCALLAFAILGRMDLLVNIAHIDPSTAMKVFVLYGFGSLLAIIRSTTTTIYIAAGNFAVSILLSAAILMASTCASVVVALMGGGPFVLALSYFIVTGVAGVVYVQWDTRRRYPNMQGPPEIPNSVEFTAAVRHVKWFALQTFAPAIWLQMPILLLNASKVAGHEITAFLLIRTMANQLRLIFQFAAVGTGIEIATHAHAGEFERAWRLSAIVGVLTTVLCAASAAAIMSFGPVITLYWTGDPTLFSFNMAFLMLIPMLLVAPLQQPTSMLQFANMTFAPGLQRLLQIALGPVLCLAGQYVGGAMGLVAGLAIAEVVAYWSVVGLIARIDFFTGFARYAMISLSAGAAAFIWSLIVGDALTAAFASIGVIAMGFKLAIWSIITVAPLSYICLPTSSRARLNIVLHSAMTFALRRMSRFMP